MQTSPTAFAALNDRRCQILLAGLTALVAALVLKLQQDWWFEDDPNIIHFVRTWPNPLDYFFNRDAWLVLSPARILTPMQPLSFKLDAWLGGAPQQYYGHAALVLLIALLAGYHLLRHLMEPPAALVTTTLWLLNPATASVLEFLAARHYLEGLALGLLSCLAAVRAAQTPGAKGWPWACLAMTLWLLAALCKELYVTTGIWLLFMIFWSGRRPGMAMTCTVPFVAYFAYRIWMIGLVGQGFDHALSFLAAYPRFLASLPFMTFGHRGGYLLLLLLTPTLPRLWISIRDLWRQPATRLKLLWWGIFWTGNLAVALLTIFPVSGPLYADYRGLGPWYRVALVLNLVLLTMGAHLTTLLKDQRLQWLLALAALVVAGLGAHDTAKAWDRLKAHYTADGQFYRNHPDRLLYSTLPAFYLSGIHNLYHGKEKRRFITSNDLTEEAFSLLNRYDEVWADLGDGFRVHPGLHRTLTVNLTREITPLHQPLDATAAATAPRTTQIQYQDGKLTMIRSLHGVERGGTMALPSPSGVSHLFLPGTATSSQCKLLIANPSDGPIAIELAFHRGARVLQTDTVRLDAGEFQLTDLEPQDACDLLVLRAERPIHAGLTAETDAGQPLFLPAIAPSQSPRRYIAHIPNPEIWSTRLLLRNADGAPMPAVLTLYDASGAAHTVPIPASGDLDLSAIDGLVPTAGFLEGSGVFSCLLAYQTRDGAQITYLTPTSQSGEAFDLSRVAPIEGYVNLALFNPGAEAVTATLIGDNQKDVLARRISPFNRLAFTHKLGTRGLIRLDSDHPLVVTTVGYTPWGQYQLIHPPTLMDEPLFTP